MVGDTNTANDPSSFKFAVPDDNDDNSDDNDDDGDDSTNNNDDGGSDIDDYDYDGDVDDTNVYMILQPSHLTIN